MNIYQTIIWFFMFSFMGYLLECTVLSCENKTPVLNRGFVHGPFCIIYGFGAAGAYLLLRPFAEDPVKLYLTSMAMATVMEIITANLMIRLFGSFWWDYSHKSFNYRGMVCLESSLAWGFLGIFFFKFLDGFVISTVSMIPSGIGRGLAILLVVGYLADFTYTLRSHLQDDDDDDDRPVLGRLKVY